MRLLWQVLLCTGPLAYGAWLAWSEWMFRRDLPARPVAVAVDTAPVPPRSLNHAAVATVLGLQAHDVLARSREPLQLRASFVASAGASRALLAGAEGQRVYRVGDRLPGGSILRRIEVGRVVLWREGREELLTLAPPARSALLPAGRAASASAPSPVHLRPASPGIQVNP